MPFSCRFHAVLHSSSEPLAGMRQDYPLEALPTPMEDGPKMIAHMFMKPLEFAAI